MTTPTPAPKKTSPIVYGCAAVFVLVLACGVIANLGPRRATPAPTAAVAPTEPPPTTVPTEAPTAPVRPSRPVGYVSRATLAGWPLTVEEGIVQCLRPQQVYFLSLDRQRVWAVNAPARSQIEEKGWSDIMEIRTPGADLAPLIDAGLALCP